MIISYILIISIKIKNYLIILGLWEWKTYKHNVISAQWEKNVSRYC
jgi:hypothetical protein